MGQVEPTRLLLGLIGDNIAASSSPRLHQLAGELTGQEVRYDRLVPAEQGLDFDALFARCAAGGYRGLNITYPYKERVRSKVHPFDPLIEAIGAINTVRFTARGPVGYNTDYTGFIAAYETVRGTATPGSAALIGTGGVGRAIAFALGKLQADEIRLFDRDRSKADALKGELEQQFPAVTVKVTESIEEICFGADGIINATPIGMFGYEGSPVPATFMKNAAWVFDAVYTPLETEFLKAAADMGITIISGWELFFWQGCHAWSAFSDVDVAVPQLRALLEAEREAA